MRRLYERLSKVVDTQDVITFGGLGIASYGASMVYAPSGYILFGIALFWLGVRR